jgi:hypothetical protein
MYSNITRFVPAVGFLLALTFTPGPVAASGPQLDVRTFGARCNGVTDDSKALQAALDSIPSSGGSVLIPCQLAIGSSGVRVSGKSNVEIKGTAPGAGIKSLARTHQGALGFGPATLVLQHCTNCEVRDLNFTSNNIGVGAIALDRCTATVIENNTITDVGGNVIGGALMAAGGRDNQYLRNRIERTGNANGVATRGMWIGNWSALENEWRPVIKENTIRNAAATGIATHAIGATIADNVVDTTSGAGIKITPPPGLSSGMTIVEGNTLKRNTFHGIQINNGFDLIVRNNIVEEN